MAKYPPIAITDHVVSMEMLVLDGFFYWAVYNISISSLTKQHQEYGKEDVSMSMQLPILYNFLTIVGITLSTAGWITFFFVAMRSIYYDGGLLKISISQEKAVEMLKQDINRTFESMIIFTDSSEYWLWEKVSEDLSAFALLGVGIVFIVSDSDSGQQEIKTILNPFNLPGIQFFQIPIKPPINLRFVDNKHFHVTYRGTGKESEQSCLRSTSDDTPRREVEALRAFIFNFLPLMKPVLKTA